MFPCFENAGAIMSLLDALKVPSFDVFDFDFEDQGEGEVPLMKQVAPSAQEIRHVVSQDVPRQAAAETASSIPQGTHDQNTAETVSSLPTSSKGAVSSSESQAGKMSILDDVDSDPEVRSLDEALQYRPSSASLKGKGVMHGVDHQPLVWKRKTESIQIRSSDPLPKPTMKKNKKGFVRSGGDVMIELDEHLTGGKFSREEATLARTEPTPTFSGGFLPVNEVESMETEVPEILSKEKGKTHGEPKVVTFSGKILDSSLGPDRFIDDEEDQVSSLPSSWFGPELMSFFRYADVFLDDMEIDPATADEKFVRDWDIRNKDSVMDELDLGAAVLANQAQSNIFVTELYRRWVETESVRENLEKEICSLKRKVLRTPETEKRIAQLTSNLQAQQEKIKFLTTQNQSIQAAAASAAEDRDRIATELKIFSQSMQEKDREHKSVMAKMEESFNNARLAYVNMMAEWDVLKTGEADLKAHIEEMKCNHEAEVGETKKENAALKASVDNLQATKTWLLSEGARLLAKNIHKGHEITAAMAAVNNAMSAVGVNSGLHNGYLHALKLKIPYAAVPLLNRNAAEELNAAVSCFDSLVFPVVEDLPKLINEPLSKIKEALTFANSGSSEK
ncbi:hypothetical protein Hanom_Chr09g00861651 [Helianthus anomalus]